MSFAEFIISDKFKSNTRKQVDYTKYCNVILRFESLKNDFKIIQRYLGIDDPLKKTNVSTPVKEDYTQKMKEIVREHFKNDFVAFGYKP